MPPDLIKFEQLVWQAIEARHHGIPVEHRAPFLQRYHAWSPSSFWAAHQHGNCFPKENANKATYFCADVWFQQQLLECDLGLSNLFVTGFDFTNPHGNPGHFIQHVSLGQSIIVKSRVLWERVMNLVYFLETNTILDDRCPRKKSKKTFFFDFIKSAPRWEFVGHHYDTLRLYDDQWRTPEVHKNSTLRKAFANGQYDPNPLYALVNSWFGL